MKTKLWERNRRTYNVTINMETKRNETERKSEYRNRTPFSLMAMALATID